MTEPNVSTPVIEYRRPGIGRMRRIRSFGEEVGKLAMLAAVFIGYGARSSREKGADLFFFFGVLMWVAIAGAIVIRRWRRAGDPSGYSATATGWRVGVAGMGVVTITSFVFPLYTAGRYTCPHGMRWANNQLGIAWSDNGGPCGNGPYQRVGAAWRIAKHWYVYRPHG